MAFPVNRTEMERRGYVFLDRARCRGCGEAMEFWRTPQRKRMPMDPMAEPESPAVSHWATCREAPLFRKGEPPAPVQPGLFGSGHNSEWIP